MRTRLFPLTLTIAFLSLPVLSQEKTEGNSAVREILENRNTQDILRTLKNNPESSIEALSRNPDDATRSAIAIFQEQMRGENEGGTGSTPATRGSVSQTDKGLANLKGLLATPAGDNSGRTGAGTSAPAMPDLERIRRTATEQLDSNRANPLVEEARRAIYGSKNGDSEIRPPAPSAPEPAAGPPPAPTSMDRAEEKDLVVNSGASMPRNMKPTAPQVPDSPELLAGDVPAPQALKPRYPKPEKFRPAPKPVQKQDTMVIESGEAEMDDKRHILTFRHDVVVEMDEMNMTCDTLVVYLDSENRMKRTVASGGMVKIERIGEEGQLQIAKARQAVHDAATRETVLTGGPPFLQDGDRYVNTDSEDARIVLGGDKTYRVDSPKASGGRQVIVVPLNSKMKTIIGQ